MNRLGGRVGGEGPGGGYRENSSRQDGSRHVSAPISLAGGGGQGGKRPTPLGQLLTSTSHVARERLGLQQKDPDVSLRRARPSWGHWERILTMRWDQQAAEWWKHPAWGDHGMPPKMAALSPDPKDESETVRRRHVLG